MCPHERVESLLQRRGVALLASASLPPVVRASFRAGLDGGFVFVLLRLVHRRRLRLDRDTRAGPHGPAVDVRAVQRRGRGASGGWIRELQHREPSVELALVSLLPLVDARAGSPVRHADGHGRGVHARECGE